MLINSFAPFAVRRPLVRYLPRPVSVSPSAPPLAAYLSLEQGWARFLAPHPWAAWVGNPLPHPWADGAGNPLPHPWLS